MDFGLNGAAFIPFFGVPAATLLATAQIAKTWDAAVVPIVSRLDANTGRYQIDVLPPLGDFPGAQTAERSEEHPSELQSLMRISYAVFFLKKKTETQKQQ